MHHEVIGPVSLDGRPEVGTLHDGVVVSVLFQDVLEDIRRESLGTLMKQGLWPHWLHQGKHDSTKQNIGPVESLLMSHGAPVLAYTAATEEAEHFPRLKQLRQLVQIAGLRCEGHKSHLCLEVQTEIEIETYIDYQTNNQYKQ